MSLPTFNTLGDSWPISGMTRATPLSDQVFQAISAASNGAVITDQLGHFSLGSFYIHTSLLEPHLTQRPLDMGHVKVLMEDFQKHGLLRSEEAGVVIGLGQGWQEMKHNNSLPFMIDPSFPHLSKLSLSPCSGQPIAQVIRGGHRTRAVKQFSESLNQPEENYWLYTVLIPGKFIFKFYSLIVIYVFLLQDTNNLPMPILNDYSCLGNMDKKSLLNSYARNCLNDANIADMVYKSKVDILTSTNKIRAVAKRASTTIGFRNLLRFKGAIEPLIRLFSAGGIWIDHCEEAFKMLVKCRNEEVSLNSPISLYSLTSYFHIGYCLYYYGVRGTNRTY